MVVNRCVLANISKLNPSPVFLLCNKLVIVIFLSSTPHILFWHNFYLFLFDMLFFFCFWFKTEAITYVPTWFLFFIFYNNSNFLKFFNDDNNIYIFINFNENNNIYNTNNNIFNSNNMNYYKNNIIYNTKYNNILETNTINYIKKYY
jgi:hypothetical protein